MHLNEARRPSHRRIPRWVWLLAAVILIPAQVYWVQYYWFDRPADESRLSRYPELESADPELCAAIRKAWKNPGGRMSFSRSKPGGFARVRRILDKAKKRGPRALLRVLVDEAPRAGGTKNRGDVGWDEDDQPCGMWLRAHAATDLDPVLLRLVADRAIHYEARTKAVVALCRPESAARIGDLAEIALDPNEVAWLRCDIVQRLPRMSVPLLAHLRPLLYQPFHDLDQDAAIALARAGEFEAPTLLLEAARGAMPNTGTDGLLLADAILKTTGEDPDVRPAAERFRRFHQRMGGTWRRGSSRESSEQAERATAEAFADSFRAWLAAHPEARATRFERERAAYLNSDARRRELAIRRFEDILETNNQDLDLGAAAIWCTRPDATPEARYWRLRNLEYLHRLSLLLAEDIGDLKEPEAIIGAMCRRLLPQRQYGTSSSWEGDRPSTLQVVLRNQEGNCVGYSLLLLAMGERLGLPLHGVRSPNHLFVRWDDGRTRRNIETTDGGSVVTDDEYRELDVSSRKITPEDVASGRYLRNVTRKHVLATLLNNLSKIHLESRNLKRGPWRFETARERASQAIRLDPDLALAYLNRGAATIELGAGEEAALGDIETVLRLDRRSARAHRMAGELHMRLERFSKALHHYDQALAADPDAVAARIGKIQVLLALDRVREALTLIESLDPEPARTYPVRSLRLTALIRLRDGRWRGQYERLLESDGEYPATLHLRIAGLLLRREDETAADPRQALFVLSRIPDHDLADGDDEGSVPLTGEGEALRLVTKKSLRAIQRKRDDLRAQAHALQADRGNSESHR